MKQKLWNIEAAFYLIWQATTYFLKKIFAFSLIYFLLFLKWGKLTIAIFSFALFMSLQFFHFLNEKQSAVLLLILFSLKNQNKYFFIFLIYSLHLLSLKKKNTFPFQPKSIWLFFRWSYFLWKAGTSPAFTPLCQGAQNISWVFLQFGFKYLVL